jgi:hypothetical protein
MGMPDPPFPPWLTLSGVGVIGRYHDDLHIGGHQDRDQFGNGLGGAEIAQRPRGSVDHIEVGGFQGSDQLRDHARFLAFLEPIVHGRQNVAVGFVE